MPPLSTFIVLRMERRCRNLTGTHAQRPVVQQRKVATRLYYVPCMICWSYKTDKRRCFPNQSDLN